VGWAIAYLAVASPLDQIGEDFLFSVHMFQHMILIYIVPPLVLYGLPSWMVDPLLSWKWMNYICKRFFNPAIAAVCFVLGYSMWHIPPLAEAALQNKNIHILEHLVMFVTAMQVWWPIMSPSKVLPRSSYGVQMLLVFGLMATQYPVLGYVAFVGEVVYPTYELAPRILPISPLDDQILAGVIMYIFNMTQSMIILCYAFYKWYQQEECSKVCIA
jgi:putative membrane protein